MSLPNPSDLEAVLRPIDSARNLPGVLYSSARVYERECEHLFRTMWVCVGRAEELADVGSFLTCTVADRPLLIVRSAADRLAAFLNVCRHRGACVVDEASGHARAFRCPYHSWTYDLEGRLAAAPLMDENPDFEATDHGLEPVRLSVWQGFLFVTLDAGAEELADQVADFPDLGPYGLHDMRVGHRIEYDVAANWKVICQNYSECYHCALVHPQLNRLTDYRSGGKSVVGRSFNGGPMELSEGFETMSMTGASSLPPIAGLSAQQRRLVHYYNLYPAFLIGLAPDYAIVHRVEARAAGSSHVICEWLFPQATLAANDFDADDIVRFWDVTNRQDWTLCERVQRGAASGLPGGPYHRLETCVHAFDRWYVERMRPFLGAADPTV